jgi:hypothetical protein
MSSIMSRYGRRNGLRPSDRQRDQLLAAINSAYRTADRLLPPKREDIDSESFSAQSGPSGTEKGHSAKLRRLRGRAVLGEILEFRYLLFRYHEQVRSASSFLCWFSNL